MKIATILFTYNRSRHTRAVLDALALNTILPQKLFIFQDGKKETTDEKEWEAVSSIISSVTWCDNEVMISNENKGLAKSIASGVTHVFKTFDAVIVLEDDCVPHPQFMEYMTKALTKYEDYSEVYHIGASSEPVNAIDNGTDAYFLGRINSWGWGTWRDRWDKFCVDYTMLGKVRKNAELNDWFHVWGEDLELHIIGNIYGKTDTWAAFWALTVIMNKGYCMSPYESLIDNIGHDGTGVHCGVGDSQLKLRPRDKLSDIVLPDRIEMVEDYEKTFSNYYPWVSKEVKNGYYKEVTLDLLELQKDKNSLGGWLKDSGIHNVMIWGRGRLCDYLIEEIGSMVSIDAIVETVPVSNTYKNLPVIGWQEIPDDILLVILIPGYDIGRITKMIGDRKLGDKIVPVDRLVRTVSEKNK